MSIKYSHIYILIYILISCQNNGDPEIHVEPLKIYGTYDTYMYKDENTLVTTGSFIISRSDSDSIAIITEEFIDIIDTGGVAQYIQDYTYFSKVIVVSLIFCTFELS